ncbi:heterokaryon incompatibility protein-domain-containing protein, partial [Schizothecium vesticola]
MIQHWLQYCDECHTTCFEGLSQPEIDATPVLPTRVIAVPAGESPRLVITNGLRGRYAALSHCWGGHSHIMCTKDTVGQFQGGIPLNELSKTVRDAIYLAQKLGIPYLWVDSLCIVQDDKQDWLEEAPRMGSVYEHAYLTFAATAAVNGDVGLFAPLQSEDIVRVPCDPERPLLGSMYLAPSTITFEEVNTSPLSRRGWVLQERLLSRRTLHFAATQVYWECQETGTNRSYGRDYNLQETWRAIVTFYSTCSLTYLSDKLPALEGVVTKLKARTSLEYHLGHW